MDAEENRPGLKAAITALGYDSPDLIVDEALSKLDAVADGARVIGVGESAHFVREFGLCRARISQYFIERCGFTHIALELDEREANILDQWLDDSNLSEKFPEGLGPLTTTLYGEFLHWLKAFSSSRSHSIKVIGIDLPNDLNPRWNCDRLIAFLEMVDVDASSIVEPLSRISKKIKGPSAAVTAFSWGALTIDERNEFIARLARVQSRMNALKPQMCERASACEFEDAMGRLDAARQTAHMLQSMFELFSGTGLQADTSLRERYAATRMQNSAAQAIDAKFLLVAHNNHIQKTAVSFGGETVAFPMGFYLAREFGPAYRAIGLTHVSRSVPEMDFPSHESPLGFNIGMVTIGEPVEGSVERALVDAGFAGELALLSLQTSAAELTSISKIRSQSAHVTTNIEAAFDAIITLPSTTVSAYVPA